MPKRAKKSSQVIPKDESKANRFVRVVKPRVNKAIKAIKLIQHCAGATYEYTPEQVAEILSALAGAVKTLQAKFETKKGVQDEFEFGK